MPNQPAHDLFARALASHQHGKPDEAEALYKALLQKHPAHADALMLLGTINAHRGNLDEAIRLFGLSLKSNPRQIAALYNLGLALTGLGRPREALDSYDAAIALKPDFIEAHLNRGSTLAALQRYEDALPSFEQVITLQPGHPIAHNYRGNALAELGRLAEALQSYDHAIATAPDYAEAHYNRGITQKDLGRLDDALHSYERVIALRPDYAEAHYNRGVALADLKRPEEALASLDRAITLNPLDAATLVNRGVLLTEFGRLNEALASYDKAIALDANHAQAWNNRGNLLKTLNRYEEALDSYDRAVALTTDFAGAHTNRGIALQELQRFEDALSSFDRALEIDPDCRYASGLRLHTQACIGNWDKFQQRCGSVNDSILRGSIASVPFPLLAIPATAEIQKRCAELYVSDKFPPSPRPLWGGERYSHDRIRIGYFSADFFNHPTAYLMAGLFEQHDKSRFEISAFSFGPDRRDEMSARLAKAFDRFLDVRDLGDHAIAALARELEIDIAVDLKGYTRDFRAGIFAQRPAPIQVNYLGYPGTMGAPYIDYLIADEIVIPVSSTSAYSEKIAYLPHSYQPNDNLRGGVERVPARTDVGLPESGFVFCCFNNNFKITPDVFDLWMRLLAQVEGSVLWLLEDNTSIRKNLTAEAALRGIAPGRLVFAPRVSLAEHIARHGLADLFIDTFYYNAHTQQPATRYGLDSLCSPVPAKRLRHASRQACLTRSDYPN